MFSQRRSSTTSTTSLKNVVEGASTITASSQLLFWYGDQHFAGIKMPASDWNAIIRTFRSLQTAFKRLYKLENGTRLFQFWN